MFSAFLASFLFVTGPVKTDDTDLSRVFKKGEKLAYSVEGSLTLESRQHGLDTWIPQDIDLNYQFSYWVTDVKEGIATIRYKRPTMTETEGETADSAPKKHVDKVDIDLQIGLSAVNELIDVKDMNPKKPPKKTDGGEKLNLRVANASSPQGLRSFLSQFLDEIVRLSLFVGSLDSGMDFAPRLPFEPAKIGETWKRTVGYSPQKLKGAKGDKMEMQRLDYTYTYKGPVESKGKQVLRVTAALGLNSNLADFVHQISGLTSAQTHLTKVPLTMNSELEFDLDPVTRTTLAVRAKSKASYQVNLTDFVDPVEEVRMTGQTSMQLTGRAVVAAEPATKPTPKKGGG